MRCRGIRKNFQEKLCGESVDTIDMHNFNSEDKKTGGERLC